MSDKRQMLPDNPTVTDLHAVIGELQDQLAMMHEECDEHEENDGKIIMALRAEVERLREALQSIRTYCGEWAEAGARGDWEGLCALADGALDRASCGYV